MHAGSGAVNRAYPGVGCEWNWRARGSSRNLVPFQGTLLINAQPGVETPGISPCVASRLKYHSSLAFTFLGARLPDPALASGPRAVVHELRPVCVKRGG